MLKNKTIIFLGLLFILSSVFYFLLSERTENKIESKKNDDKMIKTAKCFFKVVDNSKRIIIVNKINNKPESLEVKGADIFLNDGKLANGYSFSGFEKQSIIHTFGNSDGYSRERMYKIVEGGIIEGLVNEKNIQKIIGKKSKALRIKDATKVKFDEKFLIPSIDCSELDK